MKNWVTEFECEPPEERGDSPAQAVADNFEKFRGKVVAAGIHEVLVQEDTLLVLSKRRHSQKLIERVEKSRL